jgi:hypothetical protein
MTTGKKSLSSARELYVNEIEFHSRTEIYLYGFLKQKQEGKFFETRYRVSRNELQQILSQNKPAGIEILWHIETLFLHPHSSPASINLIELFGTTQVFNVALKLQPQQQRYTNL